MIEREDNKLADEVLKGNISAFGTLIKRYQNPVFNLAKRMVKDFDDARDITQNTFIKAYEKLSTFNNNQKFFSWLYKIAVNETLNFIKSRKGFENLCVDTLSGSENPEELYMKNEACKELNDAIMQLNPDYRLVIILKHLNELSYKEISGILGITEEKVKSRLFTARKLLNEMIIKNSEINYGK